MVEFVDSRVLSSVKKEITIKREKAGLLLDYPLREPFQKRAFWLEETVHIEVLCQNSFTLIMLSHKNYQAMLQAMHLWCWTKQRYFE